MLTLAIDMTARKVLIAGGGGVAARKIAALLPSGAAITVVAPEATEAIRRLAAAGSLEWRSVNYSDTDIENVFLVIAATNQRELNRYIADSARQKGILVTVADDPALCSCHFPAVLRSGNLEIAVTTGGTAPSFAVAVRDQLQTLIGEEFGLALSRLAALREKLLTDGNSTAYNYKFLRSAVRTMVAELFKQKDLP